MHFDFIIVGAGIAGASVGYQLAGRSRVAILEQESQPGYHSTGRSAALFAETYGTPTICALTCASRAFYVDPPAGFAEHPILTPRGVMHVAKIGQEQELVDAMALALATSPDARRLDAPEVLARCPVLRVPTRRLPFPAVRDRASRRARKSASGCARCARRAT